MRTANKRKRRGRRGLRIIFETFFILGSFGLLVIFAVYSIKEWEKSKWEEAVSGEEGGTVTDMAAGEDGYGTGGYGSSGDGKVLEGESYSPAQPGNYDLENPVPEKPIKRTPGEVLERLRELSDSYPKIEDILEEQETYPEEMLAALANNPEMTDFVAGYKDKKQRREKMENNGLTKEEKRQDYPLFLQWDSRWGYVSYGDDSNIGLSGCGPTCLSMVLYYKTKDASRTPDVLASYAMKQGYYVSGTGTAWAFMEEAAVKYGLHYKKPTKSEEALKAELDKGRFIICAMGPGDFTAAGHFVVLYDYDEEGFFINDPNSGARSAKKWSYDEISGQIKAIWSYY